MLQKSAEGLLGRGFLKHARKDHRLLFNDRLDRQRLGRLHQSLGLNQRLQGLELLLARFDIGISGSKLDSLSRIDSRLKRSKAEKSNRRGRAKTRGFVRQMGQGQKRLPYNG